MTSSNRQVVGEAGLAAAAPNLDPHAAVAAHGEPTPVVPLPRPNGVPWLALGASIPVLAGLAGALGVTLQAVSERRAAVRYATRRQWLGAASAAVALVAAALSLHSKWRAQRATEIDMDEDDPPLFV